jgi:hypothetical protein
MIYYGFNHEAANSPTDLSISFPASTAPLQLSTARLTMSDIATSKEPKNGLPPGDKPLIPPHPVAFCQEPSHVHHASIRDSDTLLKCSGCRKFTSCVRCLTTSSRALRSAQIEVFKYPAKTLAPLCDSCAIPVMADLRFGGSNNCTCPTRLRISTSGPNGLRKFWPQGPVLCITCRSRHLQRLVHAIRIYERLCAQANGRRICAGCQKVLKTERYFALMCLGCKKDATFNTNAGTAAVENWEMPPGRQTWETATAHIIGGMSCLEKEPRP